MKKIIGLLTLLFATTAFGFSGTPQDHFTCNAAEPFSSFLKTQCYIDNEPYIPPDYPEGQPWNHPVAFIYPATVTEPLKIKVKLSGYNAAPDQFCTGLDFSEPGTMLIKPCAGHWPNMNQHLVSGQEAHGWWGYFKGQSNSWRLGISITQSTQLVPPIDENTPSMDWGKGITLEGTSYGGTGVILQSMLLNKADAWWAQFITIVHAQVPTTMFVQDELPVNNSVQLAWAGEDPQSANFNWISALGGNKNIYYRVNGSPADTAVKFNTDFFQKCDQWKVACFGTWHNAGHNITEPGINLPFTALYAGEKQDVRKDKILPIFTNSTANHWGTDRGHYNLGLSWDTSGFVDTPEQVVVPLRYKRHINIGGGVPDQPIYAAADVTLRRIQNMDLSVVGSEFDWNFGGYMSGTATVQKAGEITIEDLFFGTSDVNFINLTLTPKAPPPDRIITYVRQPRAITLVSSDPLIEDSSNWQHNPDIARMLKISETDLVLENLTTGQIDVIHNCTTDNRICAVQEPRVSPDGKRIIYSESVGNTFWPVAAFGTGFMTELMDFNTINSYLWVYEMETGNKYQISSGYIDRDPDWLDNEWIVFTSTRAGKYPPLSHHGNDYPWKSHQVYKARITSNNTIQDLENLTPEEAMAMAPTVMTNGDICYVGWQGYGQRGYTHTAQNMWWAQVMDSNGANGLVELGAHGSGYIKKRDYITSWADPNRSGEGVTEIRGLRHCTEIHKDYVAIDNYYRGNSTGAFGAIFGWERLPKGVEGVTKMSNYVHRYYDSTTDGSGRFIPSTLLNLTPYGTDQDSNIPVFHQDGRSSGRAGYAFPWPESWCPTEYPMCWGYIQMRGWGYEAIPVQYANEAAMGGEPTAKKVIRIAYGPQVTNPFDTTQFEDIACTEDEWQCWGVRPVVPYMELYGQEAPTLAPPLTPGACYLQVVNMGNFELDEIPTPEPQAVKDQNKISFQGNADQPELITKFVLHTIQPWDVLPTHQGHMSKEVMIKQAIHPVDKSVRVQVPCNVPFVMSGEDDAGNVRATDNKTHSLRSGETRTCYGCHDGHSEERYAEIGGISAEVLFAFTCSHPLNTGLPQCQTNP